MAKSRARFLSELLGTTGLVKKSKSALAGADEVIDLSPLPSITINSSATSLGGSVTLTTANVAENTNLYYTDARADARIALVIDSAPSTLNTLNELAAALGDDANFSTTVTNSIAAKLPLAGGTLTGNLSLGDNVRARFGAGSDLQIYHDGSNSYIAENGTGDLYLKATSLVLANSAGANYLVAYNGGSVNLYHNANQKLSTTSTGIDVTGSATVDGLTSVVGSDAQGKFSGWSPTGSTSNVHGAIELGSNASYQGIIAYDGSNNTRFLFDNSWSGTPSTFEFRTNTAATAKTHLKIEGSGDISFYEDTGTTPKMVWDASAEELQIGGNLLNLSGVSSGTTGARISANGNGTLRLASGGVDALTIVDGGNATFSGTISSGAITSSGAIESTSLQTQNIYLSTALYTLNTAGNGWDSTINRNSGSPTANLPGGITSGNITTTGYLRGPSTFTIDPAAHGDDTGTVVIAGNLQIDGTTTTINSTTLTVDDKNITLASGAANAAAANGAGITVDGASATITYDGTNDEWDFNKPTHVEVAGSRIAEFGRTGAGTFDLTISDIGTGAAQLWFQAQTNDNGFVFRPKDSSGNSTNALYIAPDGDVGIGTTSPAQKLHVQGTTSTIRVQSTNSGSNASIWFNSNVGGTQANRWEIGTNISAGGDLEVYDRLNGASRMVIEPSGNVGIGTIAPTMPLSVQAASNAYAISMHGRSDGYSELYGASNDGSTKYSFLQSHSAQTKLYTLVNTPLLFGTNSTERMRISNTGNVGIGTTAPANKLHVKAGASGATTFDSRYNLTLEDDGENYLGIYAPNNSFSGVRFVNADNSIRGHIDYYLGTQGDKFVMYSQNGWDFQYPSVGLQQQFKPNGNVNLGATHAGFSGWRVLNIRQSSTGGMVNFDEDDGTRAFSFANQGVGMRYQAHITGGYHRFETHALGSGTAMMITDAGNVGIGTNAPSSRLHVVSGATRSTGGTVRINKHDNNCGLFLHSDAQSSHYNWMITTQDTVHEGIEFIPSTVVGGTTFSSPAMSIVASTGEMRAKSLLLETNSPIRFIANGSENTYMRSVIYAHQNNTSANYNNGMHIEMGRITDSSTAEVRAFVVGARGGQSSFKVTERAAGVTQADGDYLVKMYDLNADGFIDLSTGQATPVVKTRITSYGTNYFTPAGTTTTNRAMVSIGSNNGARAGILNVDSSSTNVHGGIRHRMSGGTQYLNIASIHTGSGSLPYWHIKTNAYYNQNVMFVARVHGYAYGNSGHIIDMQRSGYAYSGSSTALVGSQFVNNGSGTGDSLVPYYTSAGQLCFRAYAGASSYYTGMAFDIKMQSPTGYNHDFVIEAHVMNATSGNYYT
jgi:hypothetical protein